VTAFLNGFLKEEVYIKQPIGFEEHGKENIVCRLNCVLYGLRQSPRAWYTRIDKYLQTIGIKRSNSDANLYYKGIGQNLVIMIVYIDDLLIKGSNDQQIAHLKQQMQNIFNITDLGLIKKYLGIEFHRTAEGIMINQQVYIPEMLQEFEMRDCEPSHIPIPPGKKLLIWALNMLTAHTTAK
jgi:hypothetical protein